MVILHSISRNEGTSLIGRHCSFSHLHVYTWHCLDIVDSAHCHCYLDQDLGRRNEGGNNMLTVKSSPVTISGGTPERQKDALRADVSCGAVVLWPIGMISGQSEKQSTRIRYCCPA